VSEEKVAPDVLVLRAPPRPVVRLNRRVIAIALGGLAAMIAIALTWGLQRHDSRDAGKPAELQIQNIPHADRLDALPKDYAGLPPKLGSPLGELNAPVVKAERNAGLEVMPPRPDFRSDPNEDAARAARLLREREAESATLAQVFFQLRNLHAAEPASTAGSAPVQGSATVADGAANSQVARPGNQDHKQAFVDRATEMRIYNTGLLQAPQSRWQLMAGTVIAAALVTGINSDLPGQIIATVTEPAYDSVTGKDVLIPQGARLLGQYDAQVSFGQRRVLLAWTRLVMPDGSSITLDRVVGSDVAGNAGLEDGVDWQWKRLLPSAALSTLIGVGAELAQPNQGTNGNQIIVATRQSAQDTVNQVGQELTRRNLDIQPTLTIRPGYPIRVIVQRDLVLRPYGVPDTTEAFR
jgi:type IV secretion system protein VirB10